MSFGFPLDLIVSLALIAGFSLCAIDSFSRIMKFFKKETNGDHIRNMTNEELAVFIHENTGSWLSIIASENQVNYVLKKWLSSESYEKKN